MSRAFELGRFYFLLPLSFHLHQPFLVFVGLSPLDFRYRLWIFLCKYETLCLFVSSLIFSARTTQFCGYESCKSSKFTLLLLIFFRVRILKFIHDANRPFLGLDFDYVSVTLVNASLILALDGSKIKFLLISTFIAKLVVKVVLVECKVLRLLWICEDELVKFKLNKSFLLTCILQLILKSHKLMLFLGAERVGFANLG